jgi:hypothetical protein
MVERVLKRHPAHNRPAVRQILALGLLLALLLTGVLVVLVLTDALPVYLFVVIGTVGMAALVISDLLRRRGLDPSTQRSRPHDEGPPPTGEHSHAKRHSSARA